jgi:hypothetical protein
MRLGRANCTRLRSTPRHRLSSPRRRGPMRRAVSMGHGAWVPGLAPPGQARGRSPGTPRERLPSLAAAVPAPRVNERIVGLNQPDLSLLWRSVENALRPSFRPSEASAGIHSPGADHCGTTGGMDSGTPLRGVRNDGRSVFQQTAKLGRLPVLASSPKESSLWPASA